MMPRLACFSVPAREPAPMGALQPRLLQTTAPRGGAGRVSADGRPTRRSSHFIVRRRLAGGALTVFRLKEFRA